VSTEVRPEDREDEEDQKVKRRRTEWKDDESVQVFELLVFFF
jgi:hypothetical protein